MFDKSVPLDMMFPRATPVFKPALPVLHTADNYTSIGSNANDLGITLTDEHWLVIHFMLDFYEWCDDCPHARQLSGIMNKEFAELGGRKYLYQLFPEGPITTIRSLIDLPSLSSANDTSFGTRY